MEVPRVFLAHLYSTAYGDLKAPTASDPIPEPFNIELTSAAASAGSDRTLRQSWVYSDKFQGDWFNDLLVRLHFANDPLLRLVGFI